MAFVSASFRRCYGLAFAGHLVAGGAPHRWRNAGRAAGISAPLGICKLLGIALYFALPRNAKAKIAERTFATLSRVIDDQPEFAGVHAGHVPGASPGGAVVPKPIETVRAVLRREVDRHNGETGRKSQGARGRSYLQVFEDGSKDRIRRVPTARQLYLSGLAWKPVAVDRNGQVMVGGWTYGGPDTQDTLLRHHGAGQRILFGRDPFDFGQPGLAFAGDGTLICEGILPIAAGAYGSMAGVRQAARNAKATRDAGRTTAASGRGRRC